MSNAIFHTYLQRFCPVLAEEADVLYELFTPFSLARKQHCQEEGQRIETIFFVETGILRGYYLKDGDEITSSFYFGPALVGDVVALREQTPTMLNIQALDHCEMARAKLTDIDQLAPTYPFIYRLLMVLFERLYAFNHKRQLSFIYDSPTERYLKLMNERPKVMAQIPQHYIASYLGIQPESLSRIRKRIMED